MTGYKYDSKYSANGTQCYIWTDTKDVATNVAYKSMALFFDRSSSTTRVTTTAAPRRSGVIVRAVKAGAETPQPVMEYVDLGLPSGTLWAACNVGASSPEGYGSFYAWGETNVKDTYSWSNYLYASGSQSSVQNIGTHIAGTMFDVATQTLGNDWVMPTLNQANELLEKCTATIATLNGVKGVQLKGPNGNTIFIPMTGYKYDAKYSANGTQCYLWTDTKDIVTNVAYKSMSLFFDCKSSTASVTTTAAPRRSGVIVRAVKAGVNFANSDEFDTDDVNGINPLVPTDGATYTLQGIKVEGNLQPGVYIRNGKKFVVK